jgi:hypothetical protein
VRAGAIGSASGPPERSRPRAPRRVRRRR